MDTTHRITTTTLIRTEDDVRFGFPGETLAAKFDRIRKGQPARDGYDRIPGVGAFSSADRHGDYLVTARRAFDDARYRGAEYDVDSLTIGQVYALYVHAAIEEAEADYARDLDALLATPALVGRAFADACRPVERRQARRRNAAVKAAYGITYTAFIAD